MLLPTLLLALSAQSPTFDAASVKLTPKDLPPAAWATTGGPGTSDPGRFHTGRATMIQLLMKAYNVRFDEVVGPAWMRDFMGADYYQIDATIPPNTTPDQFRQMLQNLLAERFHLQVHRETRPYPGYELVVAKDGPKMKEVTPDPNPAPSTDVKFRGMGQDGFPILRPGPGCAGSTGSGVNGFKCQEQSMSEFAKLLDTTVALALGVDTQSGAPTSRVVDKTGLTARYSFIVQFACLGCRGLAGMNLPLLAGRGQPEAPTTASDPPGSGLPNIFSAFEKELGLKLVKAKDVPVQVLIVDRVDKTPVEN